METSTLTGPDLAYWVARANMRGHAQEGNVLRRHYGSPSRNDPAQSHQCGRLCFKKSALFCPTAVLGIERKALKDGCSPVGPGKLDAHLFCDRGVSNC